MIEVVNLYHLPKGWENDSQYVYIGRAGKGQDGCFGNPVVPQPGKTPGSTLPEYELYLKERIENDLIFRKRVQQLKDKKLVCFCTPKGGFSEFAPEKCHGQVLVRYCELLNGN
jgi:hypothetical protein